MINLKSEFDKLYINKSITVVSTTWNKLKSEVDKLGVDELKIISVDLKKLSDILKYEVVKKNNIKILNSKVVVVDNKISSTKTFIPKSIYDSDYKNL